MPAKHTLHVALTEPLVRYVRDKVAAGHYPTASDMVRVALRTQIEREQAALLDQHRHDRPEKLGRG